MGNKKMLGAGIAFAAGAAIGYVASLFLSTEERDKQKKKIVELTDKLPTEKVDELTTALFGKSTKEMKAKMDDVFADFQTRVDKVKKTAKSIDTKKYQQVVTDFVKEVQKTHDFSAEQVKQLQDFLKSDYKKVMKETK
ncbi:hypothetical protein LRY58_05735 [Candidatus Woesebacteria bacterium]|nr:hypothetical protein [Candidatus Woesebacteria bacterium]MCD8545881.1 hypothetical protein [Candidatus Woesebacteria bacterium]